MPKKEIHYIEDAIRKINLFNKLTNLLSQFDKNNFIKEKL